MLRVAAATLVAVLGCLGSLGGLAGCASSRSTAPTSTTQAPPPQRPTTAERGLTVFTYIISERDQGALARGLAPYIETPQDELTASGLRIVRAPADRVAPLLRGLSVLGSQRRLVGVLHRHAPISQSASWNGVARLSMSDGELILGSGRLRLLARCWVAPDTGRSPPRGPVRSAMVVELLPQHEAAERAPRSLATGVSSARLDERDAGLCFERLASAFSLSRDEVLIIAPISPDRDWAELIARETAPRPEASDPVIAGPPRARQPTLGEAMLTDYAPDGLVRSRALLILTPDLPPEFQLLP